MNTFLIPTDFSLNNKEHIYVLQQGLVALGYPINAEEIKERNFGAETRKAVMQFQQEYGLIVSEKIPADTVTQLNTLLERKYRICGIVTNGSGLPVEGVTLICRIVSFYGDMESIGSCITLRDGSYRMYLNIAGYLDEKELLTNKLSVKIVDNPDKTTFSSGYLVIDNTESIFNFSSDMFSYKGDPIYTSLLKQLNSLGIEISKFSYFLPKDFQQLASITGIDIEIWMRFLLATLLDKDKQTQEFYFGYLYQNIPVNMPLQLFAEEFLEDDKKWITDIEKYKITIVTGLNLLDAESLKAYTQWACKESYISEFSEDAIKGMVEKLLSLNESMTYKNDILEGGTSLKVIIDLAVQDMLPEEKKIEVAHLFIANITDFNAFIDALHNKENESKYGTENVKKLTDVFQISRVVRNWLPTIDYVTNRYVSEIKEQGYRFLGALTYEEVSIIARENPPEDLKEKYTDFIWNNIQRLFPDLNTLNRLEPLGKFAFLDKIKNALIANKDFNLLTDNVNDLKVEEGAKQELEAIQRVYRMTPSPQVAATIVGAGIQNAGEVYFMGKQQLEKQFQSTLTQEEIDSVFNMASGRFSNSLSAFANINQALNIGNAAMIPRDEVAAMVKDLQNEFPDIALLFGSTDYCECEHDESVYSAAAYLADILTFMRARKAKKGTSLKNVFDTRRSDISQIYLNTQNTNTVMPYIDLVCEVLEEAVLKGFRPQYKRAVEQCQSTLSYTELCAAPEHVLQDMKKTAYDYLATSLYPMFAPLNIYQKEGNAYLTKMGVDRFELMRRFQTTPSGSEQQPANAQIAGEFFGLTPFEVNCVTALSPESAVARNATWRKMQNIGSNTYKMSIPDFMLDSRLSIHQVFDLLWGKPWVGLTKEPVFDDCSYHNKFVTGTSEGFDRAHRFIRVWQKSGWKIWELDLLLKSATLCQNTSDPDSLNETALYHLFLFKQQQKLLNLPCDALLVFYEDINCLSGSENTKPVTSLYERVFLSKAVSNPVNENLEAIFKDQQILQPLKKEFVEEDYPVIAAALRISAEDMDTLMKNYENIGDLPSDIKCLSYLYRHATLAQKEKTAIPDLLTIKKMQGCGLQTNFGKTPEEVNAFIETIRKIKASKLPISTYDFLVNNPENHPLQLSENTVTDYIDELKKQFSSLLRQPENGDITKEGDPLVYRATSSYKQLFTDHLSASERFHNEDDIKLLIQLIESSVTMDYDEIEAFSIRFLPEVLDILFNPENLRNTRIQNADELIARYKHVVDYINATNDALAVEAKLIEIFDLPKSVADTYLLYPYKTQNETSISILQEFCNRGNYATPPATILAYNLHLLHKFTLLVKEYRIATVDFPLLFQLCTRSENTPFDFDWFGLQKSANDLAQFLELFAMYQLQLLWGTSEEKGSLFLLLATSTPSSESDFISRLSLLTGWNLEDLKSISSTFYPPNLAAYYRSQTYLDIEKRLAYRNSTNVTIETLIKWVQATEDTESSIYKEIKEATKSHYEKEAWLAMLPELQKPIREAKADALASYLIADSLRNPSPIWNDKADLYNYFLLDTEMTSCMKTSRIVQATCSVQLFMQRCLLNLEKEVEANEDTDGNWKQWEWMKKYRLWEANRKVFLYPENWIEPELRDQKTPFFKELEDELNQGDIDAQQVETVFENYLQKLHAVSNLTVCGIHRETENNTDGLTKDNLNAKGSKVDTLHVIARTKSSPTQYFYRSYDALTGQWSHWEKVELDIKGETVVPMVYNRKLHLFWLMTVEKTYNNNNKSNNNANAESSAPYIYTEIQLGWSVLKNKKWSGVQYAPNKHLAYGHHPISDFSLVSEYNAGQNELMFSVYYYCSEFYNKKDPNNYFSWNYKSGVFIFDGEVTQVYTNLYMFEKEVEKIINRENMPFISSIEIYKEYVANASGENSKSNKSIFDKLLAKTEVDVRPVPIIILPGGDSVIWPEKSRFWASKWYPMHEENGKKQLFLHDPQTMSARFLSTGNDNPHIVSAIHNQPSIWHARVKSHLYNTFFYQDMRRSFFVSPFNPEDQNRYHYNMAPFYHPYTKLFIKELNRIGIEGLLNREIQVDPQNFFPKNTFRFEEEYTGNHISLDKGYNKEHDILDFNLSGAYSAYNWELFFHTPLYIACKLSQNQKYADAMKWFEYIFNPTDKSSNFSPQKYWITKPFFEQSTLANREEQIRNILKNIKTHAAEVNAWLNNPYNPHLIARTRPTAYQRTVVMKYVDNVIAWADQLFRQDSMESNNEATLLYVLAYEILGKRPAMLPKKGIQTADFNYEKIVEWGNTFNRINTYDTAFQYTFEKNTEIANITKPEISQPAFYQQTSQYQYSQQQPMQKTASSTGKKEIFPIKPTGQGSSLNLVAQSQSIAIPYLYTPTNENLPAIDATNFCIPFNEDMLKYWNTVEDRLFKLRNCMNIEGVVRELPLFEPPIDPAMLVKAAAAGLSIGEALNDITAPQPYYRFRIMMQKAVEFTNEVKQLGDKLLSALEKKDAETLSLLRSNQEITLQKAMKQLRKLQIDEAVQQVESIQENIKNTNARYAYYSSREYMNKLEGTAYQLGISAGVLSVVSSQLSAVASGLSMIPQFQAGGAGIAASPYATATFGGQQISAGVNSIAISISGIAQGLDRSSSRLLTQAGYQRRKEDWDFQAQMAKLEINQLNKQLTASEIRLMLAEKELENLEMQIEQSQSVKEYYQSKYTNEALYNWMITQLSGLYFQAYKLAYDTAKKAEKSYCHELGIYEITSFIQFGYWDSLKKGLLAGDKLIHDLHRLDAAYLDNNRRTLELTKHVSLAQIYPNKLAELIESKETVLPLEEFLFDMDYPGHYKRRIKSVSVTIPNVAGPYTTVSFMLTLLNAKIRKNTALNSEQRYKEDPIGNDPRFVYQTGGTQSICTGSAQNDSGLFELNFGDERYLPFENAGAISQWKLKFPAGVDQFDLSTVSDVVLHIQYTAVYDGILEAKAREALQEDLPALGALFFSPKQDFPDNWNQMSPSTSPVSVGFAISNAMLPYFFRGYTEAKTVEVVALLVLRQPVSSAPVCRIGHAEGGLQELQTTHTRNHLVRYQFNLAPSLKTTATWKIEIEGIAPQEVEDLCIGFALNGEGSEVNRIFNSVFMEQFN